MQVAKFKWKATRKATKNGKDTECHTINLYTNIPAKSHHISHSSFQLSAIVGVDIFQPRIVIKNETVTLTCLCTVVITIQMIDAQSQVPLLAPRCNLFQPASLLGTLRMQYAVACETLVLSQ